MLLYQANATMMNALFLFFSFTSLVPSLVTAFLVVSPISYVHSSSSSLLPRFAWATNDEHEFSGVRKHWVTNSFQNHDERRRMLPPSSSSSSTARRRQWDGQEYDRYDVRDNGRYREDGRYREGGRYREDGRYDYQDEAHEQNDRGRGERDYNRAPGQQGHTQMERDYNRGYRKDDWDRRRRQQQEERESPWDGRRGGKVIASTSAWGNTRSRSRRAEPPARRRTTSGARNDTNQNYYNTRNDDFINVWDMNLHFMVPSHIPNQVFDEMSPRERLTQEEILVIDGNVLRNKLPKYAYFRALTERDMREYMARYY